MKHIKAFLLVGFLLGMGACIPSEDSVKVVSIDSGVLDTVPLETWGIKFDAKGQGEVYVDIHRLAYGEDSLVCTDTVLVDGDSTYSAQIPVDFRHPVIWEGHFYAQVRWLDQTMFSDTAWLSNTYDIPPDLPQVEGANIMMLVYYNNPTPTTPDYDTLVESYIGFAVDLRVYDVVTYTIPPYPSDDRYANQFRMMNPVLFSELKPIYDTITFYAVAANLAGKDSLDYTVYTGDITDTMWWWR